MGWSVGLMVMVAVVFSPAVGQTPFTVSVAQDVYQAEENSSVTLSWSYPVSADTPDPLFIHAASVKPPRSVYLYDSRSEAEPYQDELYRGRVRCDPVLARTGRIKCVFADLKLSDAGTYLCYVDVDGRYQGSKACELNVTAARSQAVKDPSEAVSRGRSGLCISAGLVLLVAAALAVVALSTGSKDL